jgi:predicted nucleotidyltransferase
VTLGGAVVTVPAEVAAKKAVAPDCPKSGDVSHCTYGSRSDYRKLREHAPELKAAGIVHLSLHGSYARGTEIRGSSDVDVIAEFDPRRRFSLVDMVAIENRLTDLLGVLRKAGAPIDNNICERALKKSILYRKNSLFYLTENGAQVGDIFMSLIHTAELCGANPFDYLTELQRHADEVKGNPSRWMPWNYCTTLQRGDTRIDSG